MRVRGRLLIENGHPQDREYRDAPEWGNLHIGHVFLELHPFDWTSIELVEAAGDVTHENLIVVAPLYEMAFTPYYDPDVKDAIKNQFAGVDSHVHFEWDGSTFHNSVSASIEIQAPPAPPGINPATTNPYYSECVVANGTGRILDDVRTITVVPGAVRISAHVDAPPVQQYGLTSIADINDPANGKSVLVLYYRVAWHPLDLKGQLSPSCSPATNPPNKPITITVTAKDDFSGAAVPNGFIYDARPGPVRPAEKVPIGQFGKPFTVNVPGHKDHDGNWVFPQWMLRAPNYPDIYVDAREVIGVPGAG